MLDVDYYLLPEIESKMLVAKCDNSYLRKITEYWVNKANTPKTFSEALLLAGKVQAEKEALETKITLDAPKVQFADQIVKENKQVQINTYAKSLSKEHGVKIGGNKLFAFLRDRGYLMEGRDKYEHNYPYQRGEV